MKASTEQKKKKRPVLMVIIIVLIVIFGVGAGLVLFSYTSDKETPVKEFIDETTSGEIFKKADNNGETVEGGDEIDLSVPEAGPYEGSEAEESVKKEISGGDLNSLKEKVGDKGFVNKAYGYAFIPPEGWYADKINSDISPFIYFTTYNPEDQPSVSDIEGVKLEVVVQSNPKDLSLEDWVAEGHTYMEPVSEDKVSVGNYEAYKEEVEYQGPMSVITFFKDGDVYTFAMYGSEEEYNDKKGEFDKVVESLIVL